MHQVHDGAGATDVTVARVADIIVGSVFSGSSGRRLRVFAIRSAAVVGERGVFRLVADRPLQHRLSVSLVLLFAVGRAKLSAARAKPCFRSAVNNLHWRAVFGAGGKRFQFGWIEQMHFPFVEAEPALLAKTRQQTADAFNRQAQITGDVFA